MTNLPNRRSVRLAGFDYSSESTYFITACTFGHRHLFGAVCDGQMNLSPAGQLVSDAWVRTLGIRRELIPHAFVVMPNHVHALFSLDPCALTECARISFQPAERARTRPPHSVATIVGAWKADATRNIRQLTGKRAYRVWQERYHDHIVRNQQEFETISQYIESNPARWEEDRYR